MTMNRAVGLIMVATAVVIGGFADRPRNRSRRFRPPSTRSGRRSPRSRAPPAPGRCRPTGDGSCTASRAPNRNNELRVVEIASGKTTTAAFGEQPVFSSDSKWLAYGIGVSEAEEEKLQKARKPVRRKAGILNLATGTITTVDEIESFAFSADGRDLAMRVYPPEPPRQERPDGAGRSRRRRARQARQHLDRAATSRPAADMTFGNVTEYAWQSKGPLLAFTIGVDGRRGNGVQLYNPGDRRAARARLR